MKTVLVTGGAGFIGSNFVQHLTNKYPHYKIIVLDALTYAGNIRNLPQDGIQSPRFEFWYGNITNPDVVNALVCQSDIVVHFAAESHVTRSIYDNVSFFETDVMGTQVLANSILKHRARVERFIHISTSEVYGTALTDKMDEDHPLNPMSPYASAKCGADRLVYSYWKTYNIPAVIVRPFNNYGPRQHLEKLVPRFITSCLLGEKLRVHGDGSASRDWLFVQDHCEALDLIMHAEQRKVVGEVFNLGTGLSFSILEIANACKELMKTPDVKVESIVNRPGQVFRHTCDATKSKEILGWSPKTKFALGLAETIDWYRNHREWWLAQQWLREIPIVTPEGTKELH